MQFDFLDNNQPPTVVNGLLYSPDYLTVDAEEALIKQIDAQPWKTELKRRVQHYGYAYDYKTRTITTDLKIGEMPAWLEGLCDKIYAERIVSQRPNQAIVNEYQPGQGILAHVDCVTCFGKTVASLSLGSSCVMEFTHSNAQEKYAHFLEARSMIALKDDARYNWKHGISPRKNDFWQGRKIARRRRISLTFRTVIHAGHSL